MKVYMTRQPIFNCDGSVYAYDLLYSGEKTANSGGDVTHDFFGLDVKSILSGAKVFIGFSDEFIKQGVPKMFSPEMLVVKVLADQLADGEVMKAVRELKGLGYMIALDGFEYSGTYKLLFSMCDIVTLDIKAPKEELEKAAAECRGLNKLMLVKNAHTNTDADQAKKLGCTYLQGYFFVRSVTTLSRNIQPLPANLIEIMHLMAQPEPELNDIVDVMSRDAALCQKILKLINSVYFGVSNKVSSINQAILALGLDYLREWVYLMGMQKIAQNDNVEAMRLALLIAKFCRRLSGLIPEVSNDGDAFYLMGLLSMIVLSGDRSLAQALDEFPLTNDIKKGLLRCGGTYSDVFEMSLNYVDGRWNEYDVTAAKYKLSSDKVSDLFIKCAQEIGNLNMG